MAYHRPVLRWQAQGGLIYIAYCDEQRGHMEHDAVQRLWIYPMLLGTLLLPVVICVRVFQLGKAGANTGSENVCQLVWSRDSCTSHPAPVALDAFPFSQSSPYPRLESDQLPRLRPRSRGFSRKFALSWVICCWGVGFTVALRAVEMDLGLL